MCRYRFGNERDTFRQWPRDDASCDEVNVITVREIFGAQYLRKICDTCAVQTFNMLFVFRFPTTKDLAVQRAQCGGGDERHVAIAIATSPSVKS
ncbi:MAG: hypothetical protein UY39_C0051G0012 [Candidatus Kaiserbacteria bacterium GW2011_GWC2_49_12]|uniref:Uncharacterized protein n=1 Tax=Candidatus Kaiserbacteria bacterium GW2011_GWC2_49_12 TaxID=1618675 RepID=A0A0G1VHM6_9BACT|nr:MAG: hypothetical protein UY39_C0051G0012 [Candidatus Kaiserbacteria bacterium GW2011_GWC2_49_12]